MRPTAIASRVLAPAVVVTLAACGATGGGRPATASTRTGRTALAPPSGDIAQECGAEVAGVASVRLRTSDGLDLGAAVRGSGPVGVVFLHEHAATLCGWLPYMTTLPLRGVRAVAVDLRGNGASAAPSAANERRYDLDVAAAVAWLRRAGARRVVLVGASMGADVALFGGARTRPPPDAVIALSPPTEWDGMDAAALARAGGAPTTIVAARDDVEFGGDAAVIAGAARSPHLRLVMLARGGHGWDLLAVGSPARRRVDGIIRSALGLRPR